MLIELQIPEIKNVKMPVPNYDLDMDDIRSILMDICEFIDIKGCYFLVSGFGQDDWSVSINTDLAVFLEQLPKVLKEIDLKNSTEIDFYEQGIERVIALKPIGDFYEISCISRTDWQPNPKVEKIKYAELKQMMLKIMGNFMKLVSIISPELIHHPWVIDWLKAA